MREVLPDNAHELASGRLFISFTRVSDRKNVVVSEYNTKEELIQVQSLKGSKNTEFSKYGIYS